MIDKIPGLRKIDNNIDKIAQKYRLLESGGNRAAGWRSYGKVMTKQDVPTIISIAVGISAVMILTGRIVSVMMTKVNAQLLTAQGLG